MVKQENKAVHNDVQYMTLVMNTQKISGMLLQRFTISLHLLRFFWY